MKSQPWILALIVSLVGMGCEVSQVARDDEGLPDAPPVLTKEITEEETRKMTDFEPEEVKEKIPLAAWPDVHPDMDPAPRLLSAVLHPADIDGVSVSENGFELALPIPSGENRVSVTLRPDEGYWSAADKVWLLVDVENRGTHDLLARAEVRSLGTPEWSANRGGAWVAPGDVGTIAVILIRDIGEEELKRLTGSVLGEIDGWPGGHQRHQWRQLDLERIRNVRLQLYAEGSSLQALIRPPRAAGIFSLPTDDDIAERLTPPTDIFGQSVELDWPGKVRDRTQLQEELESEQVALANDADMPDRDPYGGWTAGPRLEATGHFRTENMDGKWWLVTPDGHLFWSFGPTGVSHRGDRSRDAALPLLRDQFEADVRDLEDPLIFPEPGVWSAYTLNVFRKYGPDYVQAYAEMAHQRLRAWGMNTIANWSAPEVMSLGRTPYTVAVHYRRPVLGGGDGHYGGHVPDVFHPDFERLTRVRLEEEAETTANDPWCIGYFVDNELKLPQPWTPAMLALESPETVYARRVLLDGLQQQYGTIEALNSAWKSDFANWNDIQRIEEEFTDAYREDMNAFSRLFYEVYFGTVRDVVKSVAPDKLYLGSRMHQHGNQLMLQVCAEFADVVSINVYDYTPYAFNPPEGFDAPVVIGEYHFGTITEYGVWGAGLGTGLDLPHAASLFKAYTRQALQHPLLVGAHWFKFMDQPLTGRFDGENYRIGFVNIADQPYPDMIRAAQAVAADMYERRSRR